jgi:hypothetical membrane protein
MASRNRKFSFSVVSGALLFAAGIQFIFLLFVSTALYPDYNVNFNYISDLGATCREGAGCMVEQPSSLIFNSTSLILGLLVIVGFLLLIVKSRKNLFGYLGVVSGIGAAGVGIFTEATGKVHGTFALFAFAAGALAAISSFRYSRFPFNAFSIILGLLSLIFLGLFLDLTLGNLTASTHSTLFGLGIGGLERLIVYPSVLWVVSFGAYLMSDSQRS